MNLSWIKWPVFSIITLAIFNILQITQNRHIYTDYNLQLLQIRLILIITGIIAALSFLIPGIRLDKKLLLQAKKTFNYKLLIGSSITLLIFNILFVLSYSAGGTIACILIKLNLLFVVLYGVLVFKERTNAKIWVALLVFLLTGIYITYQKKILMNSEAPEGI